MDQLIIKIRDLLTLTDDYTAIYHAVLDDCRSLTENTQQGTHEIFEAACSAI